MLTKKYLIAIPLLIATHCYATPVLPPISDTPTPESLANAHKIKYSIHRDCKKEADQKNLNDEDRPAYIAICVKSAVGNSIH